MEDTTIANVLKTFEDFYAQKDFKSALQTLKDHPESFSSEVWHYNLGLVYARLNQWPLSKFHFLSAEKQGLNSSQLKENILLVGERLSTSSAEKNTSISDYALSSGKVLSRGGFVTVSLLIFIVGLLWIKKQRRLKSFMFLFVLTLVPLTLKLVIDRIPEVVVLEETKVLEGPSKIFGSVTDLPPGLLLMTKSEGDWYQIIYPSRYSGWILKSSVKELE